MIRRIILDTNFLLIPAQFKVDIFSEIQRIADFKYKLYMLDKTVDELKSIIENQKGKSREAAKLALQMAKAFNVAEIKTGKGYTDSILVEESKEPGTIIATQDAELRRSLKNVIFLRQRHYLALKEGKKCFTEQKSKTM